MYKKIVISMTSCLWLIALVPFVNIQAKIISLEHATDTLLELAEIEKTAPEIEDISLILETLDQLHVFF